MPAEPDDLCPDAPGARRSAAPLLLVAAAALVDADGRVLVAQRPEGKPMAGLWEFPGGKVEPGETPERALVRELREELGVTTEGSCLAPAGFASHPLDRSHLLLLLFVCRRWGGRPEPLEGGRLQWLRTPELFRLAMPEADRPLLGLLAALI